MDEDSSAAVEAPPTGGPPSPLSGAYLLVVVGEPHTEEDKEVILKKIAQGKGTRRCSKVRTTEESTAYRIPHVANFFKGANRNPCSCETFQPRETGAGFPKKYRPGL
jgi:hypothetical protein